MNPKWMQLAADLLKKAAKKFSCNVCNDYLLPDSWTEIEKRELAESMIRNFDRVDPGRSVNPEEVAGLANCMSDWWVMLFLAKQLEQEARQ